MYYEKIKQLILLLFFLYVSPMVLAADQATPICAIITDITGEVFQKEKQLQVLDALSTGNTINVKSGARLKITFTEGLIEYTVTGPARVQLEKLSLTTLSGKKPASRRLFPQQDLKLKGGFFEQASTRTRGKDNNQALSIIAPRRTITSLNPVFRWDNRHPSTPVTFTLMDATATVIYSATTKNELQLPTDVLLQRGGHYTWKISTNVNGKTQKNQADFVVATEDDAKWRQGLTGCTSTVSKRIICALLLEQAGFRSEAQTHWLYLQQAVPGNIFVEARLNR